MEKVKALREAMATGLSRGALIDERTGDAHAVEVVAAEGDRLLAVMRFDEDGDLVPFRADAKVRIELPREGSVVYVPSRVAQVRGERGTAEVELVCRDPAEDRQRRMDIRVDTECRVRVGGPDGLWEETRTVNLSAGGALVVTELHAKEGDHVDVVLELGDLVITGKAQVVRRGVKTHGVGSRTSAALKFVDLPAEVRDRLALHVLQQQAVEKLRHKR